MTTKGSPISWSKSPRSASISLSYRFVTVGVHCCGDGGMMCFMYGHSSLLYFMSDITISFVILYVFLSCIHAWQELCPQYSFLSLLVHIMTIHLQFKFSVSYQMSSLLSEWMLFYDTVGSVPTLSLQPGYNHVTNFDQLSTLQWHTTIRQTLWATDPHCGRLLPKAFCHEIPFLVTLNQISYDKQDTFGQ